MASNQHRFLRFSTNGKVKAMIIRRAKPRKHGGAVLKLRSQRAVLKQSGQIPSLPFDKDRIRGGQIRKTQMASVCRKDCALSRRSNRPCFGLQPTGEKIVEVLKLIQIFDKLFRIQMKLLHKRTDAKTAGRAIHPPSIPSRKPKTFRNQPNGKPSQRTFISPSQKRFAVNGLRLNLSRITVVKLDRLVFQSTLPVYRTSLPSSFPGRILRLFQ